MSRKRYLHTEQVQTLLEDLLPDQPELRDALNQRLPEVFDRHAVPMTLQNAGAGGTSDVDSAIDAVFQLIHKGLPDEAIGDYESIWAKYGQALTPKQRYRIEANIGHALYSKGNSDAASEAYFRATGYYRESSDAQGLEVFAHFLRGDTAETLRLAEVLCQREPGFGRARSLWVRAHPDNAGFDHVEAEVPEDLRRDADVALALSDLAWRTGDVAAHERYARAAVAASPDWPDALSLLGGAILTSERDGASFDIERGLIPKDPGRVAEADRLFTEAIEQIPATDPMSRLAGLHFNRSLARRLSGDEHGARSDLRQAFHRDPRVPTIAVAIAMESELPVELAEVLEALEAFPPELAEWGQLQFARAWLLFRRQQPGDLDQALADVQGLSHRLGEVVPPSMRSDIVRLGLRLLSELGRASDGPTFVAELPANALHPNVLAVLRGRAELSAGGREQATEHARDAIRLLGEDVDWFARRETAVLAQACGRHPEAVLVWESLLGPESTGIDTIHLVNVLLPKIWARC